MRTESICEAKVTEEITPEQPGRIHFQGTSWKAISFTESFKPGETVEILKEDGLTMIVTKSIMNLTFEEDGGEDG